MKEYIDTIFIKENTKKVISAVNVIKNEFRVNIRCLEMRKAAETPLHSFVDRVTLVVLYTRGDGPPAPPCSSETRLK